MTTKFPRLFERMKLRKRIHMQNNKQSSLQTSGTAIISTPPSAEIFIDDTDTGIKSSAIISDIESVTTHTLKLVLDGYEDYTEVPQGDYSTVTARLNPTE